jgi:hypothetical protein
MLRTLQRDDPFFFLFCGSPRPPRFYLFRLPDDLPRAGTASSFTTDRDK